MIRAFRKSIFLALGNKSSREADLEIGGRYEIEREIARGSSGGVYLARDRAAGRPVALKLVDGATSEERDTLSRNEFTRLSGLHHPNLVEILDIGRDAATGAPFLAMEYVEGLPLPDLLHAVSEDRAIDLLTQAARALAFVHSRGLLHRDLKPANILVRADGLLKLVDFGLASDLAGRGQSPAGTLVYIPPEILTGQIPDARSDLYSLGLAFFHALTGRAPFDGATRAELVAAITEGRFPPTDTPLSAGALGRALERLTALRPSARFASAGDLIRFSIRPRRRPRPRGDETGVVPHDVPHDRTRARARQLSEAIASLARGERGGPSPLVLVGGEAGSARAASPRDAARRGAPGIAHPGRVPRDGRLAPSLRARPRAPTPPPQAAPSGASRRPAAILVPVEAAAVQGVGDAEAPGCEWRASGRGSSISSRASARNAASSPLILILEDLHWAAVRPRSAVHLGQHARGFRPSDRHAPSGERFSEEFARWLPSPAARFCGRRARAPDEEDVRRS